MDVKITVCALIIYAVSFPFLINRRGGVTAAGKILAAGAFGLHTAALVLRWAASYKAGYGHAPVSNLYESLVVLAWSVMLVSLLILWIKKSYQAILLACPVVALILLYACFAPGMDDSIRPLVPALKSNWLLIHVVTCMTGYALLSLGTILTVSGLLFKSWKDDNGGASAAYVFVSAGFAVFSLGIMTGAVWAQAAWGRYWGWDPKETWALVTWLVYASALHARKRSTHLYAYLAAFGLLCILFTYFGVNYLPGLHSYF